MHHGLRYPADEYIEQLYIVVLGIIHRIAMHCESRVVERRGRGLLGFLIQNINIYYIIYIFIYIYYTIFYGIKHAIATLMPKSAAFSKHIHDQKVDSGCSKMGHGKYMGRKGLRER